MSLPLIFIEERIASITSVRSKNVMVGPLVDNTAFRLKKGT